MGQSVKERGGRATMTPLTSLSSLSSLLLLASQLPLLTAQCSSGQWQCADNSCLLRERVCDGRPDCPDGSDEAGGCDSREEDCADFLFSCESREQCVSQVALCNGGQDCRDNSDELQPQCRHQQPPAQPQPQPSSTSIISSSYAIVI